MKNVYIGKKSVKSETATVRRHFKLSSDCTVAAN